MIVQRSPVLTRRKVAAPAPSAVSSGISDTVGTRPLSEEDGDPASIQSGSGVAEKEKSGVGESAGGGKPGTDLHTGTSQTAGDKTVGKLDESVLKKWENETVSSISRSSSDTSSEGAICRGGPTKVCGETVISEGVQCDRCDNWYHSQCQGITTAAYKAAKKYPVLTFLCTSCKADLKRGKPHQSFSSLARKVDQLDNVVRSHMSEVQHILLNQQDTITNQFAELKTKEEKTIQLLDQSLKENSLQQNNVVRSHLSEVQKIISDQQATIKNQFDELKSKEEKTIQLLDQSLSESALQKVTYADMVKGSCAEVVQKVSDQILSLPKPSALGGTKAAQDLTGALDDFMDKEKRKSNIVVHNLPEQSGDTLAERANNDASLFKMVIKDEMKLNVNVQKSFRVGKKNGDKPRLLIVTLENPSSKHDILKLAPELRHSRNYVNIYITPDLTRKEREINKKLRDELSSRKKAGESNLAIRGGKIVRLSPAPRPSKKTLVPQTGSMSNTTTGPDHPTTRPDQQADGGQMAAGVGEPKAAGDGEQMAAGAREPLVAGIGGVAVTHGAGRDRSPDPEPEQQAEGRHAAAGVGGQMTAGVGRLTRDRPTNPGNN